MEGINGELNKKRNRRLAALSLRIALAREVQKLPDLNRGDFSGWAMMRRGGVETRLIASPNVMFSDND